MCFFVHHHIAYLCNVIIYCKTRVMAKFRCWSLPFNIEYWKQCILTKEFWAWTMIPHCTLVFSLHVYHALLSTFCSWWIKQDQSIVLIKWCYKIPKKRNIDKFLWYIFYILYQMYDKYLLICEILFKVSTCILYRILQSFWIYPLLSHCVSLRFCNTLGAILLISSPELTWMISSDHYSPAFVSLFVHLNPF